MESGEVRRSPFRTSCSQCSEDVRTETQTDSGRGASVDTVNHKKYIKQEEDYRRGGTSSSVGDVAPAGDQKPVIKEEPGDEDYLCEGTSSPVEQSSHVDEENDEFQIMLVKEEESEDDGSICTTTVCGKASTLALELNIILLFCPECHG
ncbi:zinc finger protein 32-like isoform X1 [Tachysurus ichikawai]